MPGPPPRFPFTPFPTGWWAVALSGDLPAAGVAAVPFMDRQLVLYRTASGRAVAADAFCPHMGAHLGHGGLVDGENVVCPFHGFAFDAEGRCRRTAHGPPPDVSLATWPLRERNGVLLLWHHPASEAPGWEVPDLETDGWSPLASHRWRVRTHPQETTENAVDVAHLGVLHGFSDVEVAAPLAVDGPRLSIGFRKDRLVRCAGGTLRVPVEFDVRVHGLGYSHVEVRIPSLALAARLLVLPTPVDEGLVDLRIAISIPRRLRPRGAALPLRLLPPALRARVVRRVFLAWGVRDVQRDVSIWETKAYVEAPVLTRGDGPVGAYRRWCRQFYPAVPGSGTA